MPRLQTLYVIGLGLHVVVVRLGLSRPFSCSYEVTSLQQGLDIQHPKEIDACRRRFLPHVLMKLASLKAGSLVNVGIPASQTRSLYRVDALCT